MNRFNTSEYFIRRHVRQIISFIYLYIAHQNGCTQRVFNVQKMSQLNDTRQKMGKFMDIQKKSESGGAPWADRMLQRFELF